MFSLPVSLFLFLLLLLLLFLFLFYFCLCLCLYLRHGQLPHYLDQCWHVQYSQSPEDPSVQRVDISLVFPFKGTYYVTIRCHRMYTLQNNSSPLSPTNGFSGNNFSGNSSTSGLMSGGSSSNANNNNSANSKFNIIYEDCIHFRFLSSMGLYDIRKEATVFAGFLSPRNVVGRDPEFEHKFAVLRPLKGHFELNQSVKLTIAAPTQVTRMVAVNNGRWIEMQPSPAPSLKNRQLFEGDLKLRQFPDIQIHYKTKGQGFQPLYKFGPMEYESSSSSSSSSSSYVSSAGDDESGFVPSSAASSSSSIQSYIGIDNNNKHGKIVLDSRGTCFEKRLHIQQVKIGKRSCALVFETKSGVNVKAEVRAGWGSAVKINEPVKIISTGSRTPELPASMTNKNNTPSGPGAILANLANASNSNNALGGSANGSSNKTCNCTSSPCPHTAALQSYDSVGWEVQCTLSEQNDYAIHIFLSSSGSGVFRFALVLYLRIDDKKSAGQFNIDL